MNYDVSSNVETYFQQKDSTFIDNLASCRIQTLTVENYIVLGQLTALRFIEWVSKNPGGVVALPTGKTPEFFIKWIEYYLENWERESKDGLIGKLGISKPDFSSCHFFQLDEFFPINPENERSFRYFVKKYYIATLGFDPQKTHLINTYFLNEEEQKLLGGAKNMGEVFPDGHVDLSLRIRTATSKQEEFQQKAIRMFDDFCSRYEYKIREMGGIGFFLGGIGPDGHIAFNVKGSSPFSHTRLTGLNYQSEAAAAGDLGGITQVRKKKVITMGLQTITFNPQCVAIIIAAGASKAGVVAGSVLSTPTQDYPATCLQRLPNARFFISSASSVSLPRTNNFLKSTYDSTQDNSKRNALIERLVVDAALKKEETFDNLKRSYDNDSETFLKDNPDFKFIEELSVKRCSQILDIVKKSITDKISAGLKINEKETILHTGPHHDDIELAYFPHLHHLVRNKEISNHFAYCTSGYTSVTSEYLITVYEHTLERIHPSVILRDEDIETLFTTSYQNDITLYLRAVANRDKSKQDYAIARRIARCWAQELNFKDIDAIAKFISAQLECLKGFETGRREPENFHIAKGWLREMEAELVWAHFGMGVDHVNHLRLPFYSDDIFPHYPDAKKDVKPIVDMLERIQPTIVSLALDPEGSGPDTHFKCLIALFTALKEYHRCHPDINLRIWGYRNVWSRYHISDVGKVIPVSLNSFAVIKDMFDTCYVSQRNADFPSYEYDGPFSELAQKVWVEQHNDLCTLLGEDYFHKSDSMMLMRAYGMIYLKEMTFDEFKNYMIPVENLLKTKDAMQE